jgi:hypothetical protein
MYVMASRIETAKIKAEIEKLESVSWVVTDSTIQKVIKLRIEECRAELRRLQATLR